MKIPCSKPEVPHAVVELFQVFRRFRTDGGTGDFLQLGLDDGFAFFLRFLAGVVFEVFLQRHQRVGQAAVLDLPALAERHEAVAGASRAVAGRAEARHIAEIEEPLDDLVQRPRVVHVELGRIFLRAFLFLVAADAGAGRAGDLRDAEVEDALSAFFGFPR